MIKKSIILLLLVLACPLKNQCTSWLPESNLGKATALVLVGIGGSIALKKAYKNWQLFSAKQELKNNPSAFRLACLYGDLEKAQLLITVGADVNEFTEYRGSILYQVVYANGRNSGKMAQLLIENGANVDMPHDPEDLVTPLHIVAEKGNYKMGDILIKGNANVNAKSRNGCTPLHIAAGRNDMKVAKLLIENGAKVDATSNCLMTPLHFAAQNGHAEVIKMLIEAKADMLAQDDVGLTPLLTALTYSNNICSIELLIKNIIHMLLSDVSLPKKQSIECLGDYGVGDLQSLALIEILNNFERYDRKVFIQLFSGGFEQYKKILPFIDFYNKKARKFLGREIPDSVLNFCKQEHLKHIKELLRDKTIKPAFNLAIQKYQEAMRDGVVGELRCVELIEKLVNSATFEELPLEMQKIAEESIITMLELAN